MKYYIEIWKSNQNQTEVHHFLSKTPNQFGQSTYLFGYNPKYINKTVYKKILKLILSK